MRVLLGAVAGVLVAWLSRSERAREEAQRRLSTAPEALRQATKSVAAASASQAGRAAEAVDAAPLPRSVKDTLSRATMTARSAAEKWGEGTMTTATGQTATLSVQELPDGSWIGNAAWGGRTLSHGAPDPEVVIRRLAMHLASLPEADPPERITLIRISQGGLREEREEDLATLLG